MAILCQPTYYCTGVSGDGGRALLHAGMYDSHLRFPRRSDSQYGYIADRDESSQIHSLQRGRVLSALQHFPPGCATIKPAAAWDSNSHFGMLSAYYSFDQYNLLNPYTVASSVPGFGSLSKGNPKSSTWEIPKPSATRRSTSSASSLFDKNVTTPSGGTGVTLASLGFTGITPLDPGIEGVPELDFNNFNLGVLSRVFGLTENTFQWLDNYRKVVGKHTLSFGGTYHYTQLQEALLNIENGNYLFNTGTETGIDIADFLLGAPSGYNQGQTPASNGRNRYMGLYGQDSWRTTSNLTLNYGLRWEFATPWYEQHNEIETIVPGLQSKVFPGSPVGWVFPGDPARPSHFGADTL